MSQLDFATKDIIAHLNKGENNLWEAAEKLGWVVGTRDDKRGGEVVAEIEANTPYSADKIYRLARAGRAYLYLIHNAEDVAELARKKLTISHMEALASCVERKDCTGAGMIEWCKLCLSGKWKVERLRAELPKSNKFSDGGWNLRAKKAIPVLKSLVEDETLGADSKHITRVLRLGKVLVSLLERMTQ